MKALRKIFSSILTLSMGVGMVAWGSVNSQAMSGHIAGQEPVAKVSALPERAPESVPDVFKLSNGLTVLFLKDERFPLVSLRLYVHAGSTYENPEEFGLSHLLEHMVFKGTAKRPKGTVAADIEAAGGYINAATSFDYTVYLTDMPSDEWRAGLDVLKDMAFNPSLDPKELEAEKKVVLAELQRGDDTPGGLLFKRLQETAFAGTPYAHPIIGYPDTINNITRQGMLNYIKKHYQPQGMLLLICGNVNKDEVLAEVNKQFGSLKNSTGLAGLPPVDLKGLPKADKRVQVERGPWNKVYLAISFPAPGGTELTGNQLEMLAQLLGGDKTSYLYRKYKYEERLVDDIGCFNYGFERAGMLYFSVALEADKLSEFWQKFVPDLRDLAGVNFTPAEIDRAKLNLEDSLYRSKETVSGLASKVGYFQFFGSGAEEERNYLAALSSVDAAKASVLTSEFIRPEGLTMVALVPAGADPSITAPSLQKALEKDWPIAGAGKGVAETATLGDAAQTEVIELGQGRKLILLPDDTLPYISADLIFTGGDALLTPQQQGLASLAAATLTKGTAKRNATALEDFQADRAAELRASAGRQTFNIGVQSPSRFSQDMFTLLNEVLSEPAFDATEFSRAVQNQKAAIKAREDQPFSLAMRYMFPFLFNGHPYGYLQLGAEDGLSVFTPDEAKAFWQKQKKQPWVLTVCGSFARDAMLAQAQALVKTLDTPVSAEKVTVPQWQGKERELKLQLPGRNQAHLFLVFPAVPWGDADAPAFNLLQTILGGQSGLLFKDLRDKQSLGYTVTAMPWQADQAGALIFYIGTEPEKLEQAKAAFISVVRSLQQKALPEADLARGKRQMEAEYYRDHQTLDSRSGEAAALAILGRPLDAERQRIEQASALTAADLQKLAQKYLHLDAAYWVVVKP